MRPQLRQARPADGYTFLSFLLLLFSTRRSSLLSPTAKNPLTVARLQEPQSLVRDSYPGMGMLLYMLSIIEKAPIFTTQTPIY